MLHQRCAAALSVVVALLLLTACRGTAVAPSSDSRPVEPVPPPVTETAVQVLAINDFHGRLGLPEGRNGLLSTGDPGPGPDGEPGTADDGSRLVGGAAHLARTLADRRADFGGDPQDSLTVGAGDLLGASTFTSAGYSDEPAIEVLDALGLDFSAVGNHEFDRGSAELFRLSGATDGQYADDVPACRGVDRGDDGCFRDSTGEVFDGSGFTYLGANVRDVATGQPALPPYAVVPTTGGTEIGIIGVVTDTVPLGVSPSAIEGLRFEDPVVAANRAVAELQERGVEAIVLLAHEGGRQEGGGRFDTCVGELADTQAGRLNAGTDPAVDVIITGHTHTPYTCLLPDPAGDLRPVTQAQVYGGSVTDIRLTVGADGEVDRDTAVVTAVPVLREEPDPRVEGIVEHWRSRAAEVGNAPAGAVAETITRAPDPESGVGVVVADAILRAGREADAGTVLAFMNQGMLRADLVAGEDGGPGAGAAVTYRELFRAMPFDHTVQVVTLSGAAVRAALEEQFATGPGIRLSTSGGVTYTYDPERPRGDRIDPCSLQVDGRWIDPAGTYRVALTSFLRDGGDGYSAFEHATGDVTGPSVLDALATHVAETSPVAPPPEGRAVVSAERLSC